MNLIDRYLAAVRRHLPRALQDDVIQELSDNLRSEVEERERDAGRALSDEEQIAFLKKQGHPWVMASRYAAQQYLIGPGLFPYYKQTLVIVLFWVVLPLTIFTFVASGLSSGLSGRSWGHATSALLNGAVYAIGIVTTVFYVLERERVRLTAFEQWDPRTLPDFRDGRAVPRSETVAGLVFGLIFFLWWTGLVHVPDLIYYDGRPVRLVATSIWDTIYAPVLVLLVAGLGVSMIDFIRPWRTLAVSALDLAINAANVVLLLYVIRLRPQFFEVVADAAQADQLTRVARLVNGGLTWSLIVVTAVILLDMLYEIWLISRARHSVIKSVSV